MKKKSINKELMTVTTFSKTLAGILSIFLIFGAFFLGFKFKEKEQSVIKQTSSIKENTNKNIHTFTELGLSFQVPDNFYVNFEPQLNLDTQKPYAYTFTIQNYKNSPTQELSYQLYGIYQFDGEKIDESILPELKNEMNTNTANEITVAGLPAIQGQIKGERQRWVTYIIKDGYLLKLYTSEPTEENRLITEQILSTFKFL